MIRRSVLAGFAGAVAALAVRPVQAAAGFIVYKLENFDQLLAAGETIVVHVHADWCPVCTKQQATLDPMSGEFAYGKVRFVRVNFDTDLEFLKTYRVASQSTVIIFKSGKEVSRFVGVTRPADLRKRVDAAI